LFNVCEASLALSCILLQELKGNIRVFCRVRPLLPDEGVGTEAPIISYPTATEALGRGIDLTQSGMAVSVVPMTFYWTNLLMYSFCYSLQVCCLLFSIKIWCYHFMYLILAGHTYPFTFDKVFNDETSQQDVFVEISQLVQSALDGYKVNLLCLPLLFNFEIIIKYIRMCSTAVPDFFTETLVFSID
jgi:kinesin family protein C1